MGPYESCPRVRRPCLDNKEHRFSAEFTHLINSKCAFESLSRVLAL